MRRIPILVVSEGALEGARMPIPLEGLVVGREPSCDFVLSEQGVSREHCRILVHNAGVWVRDLGSRNGVFLKGKRVNRPKQMMPGGMILLGSGESVIGLTEKLEPARHFRGGWVAAGTANAEASAA